MGADPTPGRPWTDGPVEAVYGVYGLKLATRWPFRTPLPGSAPPADLHVRVVPGPRREDDWRDREPVYRSEVGDGGDPFLTIVRGEAEDVVHYRDFATFHLGGDSIEVRLLDPSLDFAVELYLLGLVLSFWLECRGTPTLHASAVALGGRAVGFLSTAQGGKSSLAAALLQRGHALLTDDLLAVRPEAGGVMAQPGFPQMRFWPDQATRFLGAAANGLERVHPAQEKLRVPVGDGGLGRFEPRPRPLAALYLPERRDRGGVDIEPVRSDRALVELVRQSFLTVSLERSDLHRLRFPLLARVVRDVPVRRLRYPSGFEHLPDVVEAVVRDLEGPATSAPSGAAGGGRDERHR